MSKSVLWRVCFCLALMAAISGVVACQSATPAVQVQQPQATINPGFQSQLSPIPTVPAYRCGSWTSNNAPNPHATITIYARLIHDTQGVAGKTATATVHFRNGDFTLNQTATSDSGGYVSFMLNLQGRQPAKVPATIDITFTNLPGGDLRCSQAFFTPI